MVHSLGGVAGAAPTLTMEEVPVCAVCGASGSTSVLACRDRYFGLPGEFQLIRCIGCGLVRLSPRPDEGSLRNYYPDSEYYSFQDVPEIGDMVRLVGGLRNFIRAVVLASMGYAGSMTATRVGRACGAWLAPLRARAGYGWPGFPSYVEGGRALDVGCGNGDFLGVLARHGWDVQGVDTSPAAERAASAHGVPVFTGALEDAGFVGESFDFVHMSHSLEHVWDPAVTLATVSRLLRPGGRLYVETPNIDSFAARRCGSYWYALESPRHLWLFGPASLRRTVAQCGLHVSSMRTKTFPSYLWEATYRGEERDGKLWSKRPRINASAMPRAVGLGALTRVVGRVRPLSRDIICCWALKPPS